MKKDEMNWLLNQPHHPHRVARTTPGKWWLSLEGRRALAAQPATFFCRTQSSSEAPVPTTSLKHPLPPLCVRQGDGGREGVHPPFSRGFLRKLSWGKWQLWEIQKLEFRKLENILILEVFYFHNQLQWHSWRMTAKMYWKTYNLIWRFILFFYFIFSILFLFSAKIKTPKFWTSEGLESLPKYKPRFDTLGVCLSCFENLVLPFLFFWFSTEFNWPHICSQPSG